MGLYNESDSKFTCTARIAGSLAQQASNYHKPLGCPGEDDF